MEMKKYRLADIAEIVISSVDKKTKPGEKIVRLCNFTDVYHNWAIKQSDYDSFMVASASDSNINKLSLKKGFVAFTKDSETRDDIGISTYIADDFDDVVLGYHCALAKPNEKIVYGKYLNAFMSSDYIKKYFELNATGSGMRFTLAVSTMEDMPIMLPSLNVQKKIGDMLSDFDKRIENLRAQNRVLEQTAKTIYDYTFLQCAGHQTTYNKTLNRNIPESWEQKSLSQIESNIITGKTPSTQCEDNFGGNISFITIDDIRQNTYIIKTARTLSEKGANTQSKKYLPEGSLCVSCIGTIGEVGFSVGSAQTNQQINSIVFSEDLNKYYLYFAIKEYFQYATPKQGATFGNMSKGEFEDIKLICPDRPTLEKFNMVVAPLFQKQLVNIKQIEALTTQRNTLLPLLMTGQIEV